ncbi:putative tyrosine--tRNA ligase [Helianthus annuus]|nr:putative tyrosine--tRNA ligase [Helianthus annuus]
MGRDETHNLTAAQVFHPCMQCADKFFLKADICQLGMDQYMLPGLKKGQEKMSKSDPCNAIFMEDEEADVIQKIDNAYCPPKVVVS